MQENSFRSGMVAVLGCPNVGKSTLVNRLVKQKVSITSRKAQTTRHAILGIYSDASSQIVFVDTPGLHPDRGQAINRYMNRAARSSLAGVDLVIFVITAKGWREQDTQALNRLNQCESPILLVINKIDRIGDKSSLLPILEESSAMENVHFSEIIPLSATTGENVENLQKVIRKYLPQQPPLFPLDQVTDRSDQFMVSELVREQIFRQIGQEVPYSAAVQVEKIERKGKLVKIESVIWVEKPGQKAILIGKGGEQLKKIGTAARKELEKYYSTKVHLALWIKLRENWRDSEPALKSFGFGEF